MLEVRAMIRAYPQILLVMLAIMLASACARITTDSKEHARAAAGGVYKVGTPYKISNKWFHPRENTSYVAEGIASWYGKKFHRKRTANGEIFDMNLISAAHPTLPMPVLVRVTNLVNGRQLVVRVNDRGPFKRNREIDLSRRAAELLGFLKQGTTRIRVEYVGRAPLYDHKARRIDTEPANYIAAKPITTQKERTAAIAAPIVPVQAKPLTNKQNYTIQVGVFSEQQNAEQLRSELAKLTDHAAKIITTRRNGQTLYHVRIGQNQPRKQARNLVAQLADAGYDTTLIAANE